MKTIKTRLPVAAGSFYPATLEAVRKQLELYVKKDAKKNDVIGCVLPHAGYIYSGGVAGETISCVNIKDTVILLGPNHTGNGEDFSIMTEGLWQTPLGEVKINSELAKEILSSSKYLIEDYLAHAEEHSLEVELPFLQYIKPNFQIVPIALMTNDIKELKDLGDEIGNKIKSLNSKDSILFVASSDMTHYEPQKEATIKDREAINAIIELNEDKLVEKIQKLNISMCGWAPVIVLLRIAKILGAKAGKLIKYETSAEATGDTSSVVGYAGITIS